MTARNLTVIIALTVSLWASLLPLHAQSAIEMQRVKNAETMIYAGRCAEAVAVLRPLFEKSPHDERTAAALKNAYVCTKDYDSAHSVLQQLMVRTGDQSRKAGIALDIAEVYFREGKLEEGKKQIALAISWMPYDIQTYEHATDVFMSNGYYADAVRFLQESRVKVNDPRQFSRKLAQLYEVMRNYGDAAREYFAMVQSDSTQDVYVAGRISSLIKLNAQEDYDTGLQKALAEIVKANPYHREAQRFYGDYLVAQGEYDQALMRFRLVDSLEDGRGRNLLYLAKLAADNGAVAMVDKACAQIAALPGSPYLVQSRFLLAEAKSRVGDFGQSAALYREILGSSPVDRDQAQAMYFLGVVTLEGLHDAQGAIATFEQITERYPRLPLAATARMLIGDCQLALGKPVEAESTYAAVNTNQLPLDDQEELLFKKAELQFYTANFDAAREAYGKVMNAFPKSTYVNDCLRRIMLISEYAGMDAPSLEVYSSALYARARFNFPETLAELAKLKSRTGAILPEVAWLQSGEIYQSLKQDDLALAEYDSLIALHPEGFYTPIALERKGDIYADSQHNCDQARAMYHQVLLNHQNSLNVEDVRKKLQRTEKFLCAPTIKTKS